VLQLKTKPEHNSTAFTPAEWLALAAKKHGAFVLVAGDLVAHRDVYLSVMGRFTLDLPAGRALRVMSHTDYVEQRMRRTAEAVLSS
jgi:hypothetical protein